MSRQPPKKILRAVERAIDLRAQGLTWAEVAKEVGAKLPETVRGWARRYADFWDHRLAAARAELEEELESLARGLLRRRMRLKDEKLISEALRLMVGLMNRRRPGDAGAAAVPEHRPIADHLEGLTDDEFRNYVLAQLADDGGAEGDVDRPVPAAAESVR